MTPTAILRRNHNWRKLGGILVGLGIFALLQQMGIGVQFIIPPLMIIGGVMLLKRGQ
jgi:hypothetical protein